MSCGMMFLFIVVCMLGQVGLWIFRSSKNAVAAPNAVILDRSQDHFAYETRFKTQVGTLYKAMNRVVITTIVYNNNESFMTRRRALQCSSLRACYFCADFAARL